MRRHQDALMSKKMSATKSHLPLHSVSARAGRCTPENTGNKEPSDLFTSLIYGLPQESTWVQLAGSYTSQGRLGTPRCHRLHVIFKLAVARHQSARHYFLRRDTIFAVLPVVTEITAHFPAGMQPSQPVVCADRVASPRLCM